MEINLTESSKPSIIVNSILFQNVSDAISVSKFLFLFYYSYSFIF